MGCYLSPKNGDTKEKWLRRNGTVIPHQNWGWGDVPPDFLPVCLVGNSAIVIHSPVELGRLMDDKIDHRKKRWYLVSVEDLLKHSNLNTFWGSKIR